MHQMGKLMSVDTYPTQTKLHRNLWPTTLQRRSNNRHASYPA